MSQEDFMQSWFHKARSILLVGLPLALLLTSAAFGNPPLRQVAAMIRCLFH